MKTREYWLDYLRAFACVLVTVGHLFMSLQEANIIQNNIFLSVFIDFIYCFHVYIFFLCSGYLLQMQKPKSIIYRIEKCCNFLCLYVLFSGITYFLKIVFSSGVNSTVSYRFWEVLLLYPINQMWYLYAIAIIFLFSKVVNSKKIAGVLLGISLIFKIACVAGLGEILPVPFNYLFDNMIWFVLGQLLAYSQLKPGKILSGIFAALFIVLFAVKTAFPVLMLEPILTFLGLMGSVGIVYNLTKTKMSVTGVWRYLSKYMLQIYLLHTICAAGIRAILLKFGVSYILPHILIGLVFSFVIPVICAIIAERIPLLNIFFFPVKTVKDFCKKRKQRNV